MPTKFVKRGPQVASTYSGEFAEIGVDSDDNRFYYNASGTRQPVQSAFRVPEALTAADTLTAEESGKTIYLNSATGFAVTLPTAAAGLNFKFVVKTAPTSGSHTIVTAASANVMVGQVLTNDFSGTTDSDFEASGGDTLSFVVNKAVKGDWAVLESDGTDWYMTGACSVFDAITITTAS